MPATSPRRRVHLTAVLAVTVLATVPAGAGQAGRISPADLMTWVRLLSSAPFEGRRTGTQGNAKARAAITDRLRAIGLVALGDEPNSYVRSFRLGTGNGAPAPSTTADGDRGANIVGLCRGSVAADGPAMVISAHYDHLGVRGGSMYPGADDNASGVAILLALAARCPASPWTHDAVFAFFDAEERGLQGARAFVAAPPIQRSRLALNVNLDMVSRSARRELFVAGTADRPELRKVLDRVAARAPISLRFGHDRPSRAAGPKDDWTMQSDHGAFHMQGIPFVYFGVEDHADYHEPSDTADRIDPAFFAQAAETILDAIDALDRWLPSARR